MKTFLFLIALLFASVYTEEMCCVECTVEGEKNTTQLIPCSTDVENAA